LAQQLSKVKRKEENFASLVKGNTLVNLAFKAYNEIFKIGLMQSPSKKIK
jgi:hypothetical protein